MHLDLCVHQFQRVYRGCIRVRCGPQVLADHPGLLQMVAGAGRQQVIDQWSCIIARAAQHLPTRALPLAFKEIDQAAIGQARCVMRLACTQPTHQGALAADQAVNQAHYQVG